MDVTLFVAPDAPAACVRLLQDLGCDLDPESTAQMIADHGFARVEYHGTRVDVFLPIVPFYEAAKDRGARVELGDATVSVWKPEVLAVFKMMFFRLKDLADVEQVLRTQGRGWIACGFERSGAKSTGNVIRGCRDGTNSVVPWTGRADHPPTAKIDPAHVSAALLAEFCRGVHDGE